MFQHFVCHCWLFSFWVAIQRFNILSVIVVDVLLMVRARDERIIPAPGCVVERELLVTCGLLSLLLSRSAPHR